MTLSEILQMREDRKNGVILCRASIDALIEHAVRLHETGDAGLNALKALVDHLADNDDEGLIEYADPMIAARKALAGHNPVAQCTNSDSWNCKYCNVVNCEALKDPRNFGIPIAAITSTKE